MRLTSRASPALRVDLRGIVPCALAALSLAQAEQLQVGYGRELLALAELFAVTGSGDETLRFEGDLSRCDRIGWQMDGGCIAVAGPAGHYVGGLMTRGTITVEGHAGDLAACEMAGGTLTVEGNTGDFACATLPGSMDGMRGGTLVVKGNAGARFGDRMRRGTALVHGNAGDFLASRMVAGTIAIGGRAGSHAGYGMRRGSVVFAGARPEVASTFVASNADVPVFWQLLARSLARHAGPFARLPSRSMRRWLGDLAVGGKGELILVE